MSKYVYNLTDEHNKTTDPRLEFEVTVVNLGNRNKPIDKIRYSYKKYHDQDWYMEATDLSGDKVDIDGNADIDWISDPLNSSTGRTDTLVQTISVDFYHFNSGKYKVRWVYDPDNSNPHAGEQHQPPIYSNWETIEVIR